MKLKKRYPIAILLVVAVVVAALWLVTRKPVEVSSGGGTVSPENTLFTTYTPETVDFQHPDDAMPVGLPPTPENIPIYNIMVKSYDFDENKTGLMYETSADDNAWCRIKQLTPSLWAYYFDDYHENRSWENGQRWNPDFNDVVLLVWKVDSNLKLKAIGSPSTFRNELWVGGTKVLENVEANIGVVLERPTPSRLR